MSKYECQRVLSVNSDGRISEVKPSIKSRYHVPGMKPSFSLDIPVMIQRKQNSAASKLKTLVSNDAKCDLMDFFATVRIRQIPQHPILPSSDARKGFSLPLTNRRSLEDSLEDSSKTALASDEMALMPDYVKVSLSRYTRGIKPKMTSDLLHILGWRKSNFSNAPETTLSTPTSLATIFFIKSHILADALDDLLLSIGLHGTEYYTTIDSMGHFIDLEVPLCQVQVQELYLLRPLSTCKNAPLPQNTLNGSQDVASIGTSDEPEVLANSEQKATYAATPLTQPLVSGESGHLLSAGTSSALRSNMHGKLSKKRLFRRSRGLSVNFNLDSHYSSIDPSHSMLLVSAPCHTSRYNITSSSTRAPGSGNVLNSSQTNQYSNLMQEIKLALPIFPVRHLKGRNYISSFFAIHLIQSIIRKLNTTRPGAMEIFHLLQSHGYIVPLPFPHLLDYDKQLFYFGPDSPSCSSTTQSTSHSSLRAGRSMSTCTYNLVTHSMENPNTLLVRNSRANLSLSESEETMSYPINKKHLSSILEFEPLKVGAMYYKAFWSLDDHSSSIIASTPSSATTSSSSLNVEPSTNELKSTSANDRKLNLVKALSSFIPKMLLRNFVNNPSPLVIPSSESFFASVLLADISGFTSLCETLTQQGPRGVEIITTHLNEYFGRMINLIQSYGGDIVKFAGDAILAIFPTSHPHGLPYTSLLASQCALLMQEKLNSYVINESTFNFHVGIGAGQISAVVIGGVHQQAEFLITGPILDQVSACAALAKSGEVYLSYQAAFAIKEYIQVSIQVAYKKTIKKKKYNWQPIHSNPPVPASNSSVSSLSGSTSNQPVKPMTTLSFSSSSLTSTPASTMVPAPSPSEPWYYCLDRIINPVSLPEPVHIPYSHSLIKNISTFVQPVVLSYLDSSSSDYFLGEIRTVSVLFVNISLKDSPEIFNLLQECAVAFQKAVYFYEGAVRQIIVDDKGYVLIAAFGLPPLSHEDDPCRGVQCALMLQRRINQMNVSSSVGITTGKVFCGSVGSETRREYAMVGDIVNLSARLMVKAAGSILCDTVTYKASVSRIAFKVLPPITIKGRTQPIDVFSPQMKKHTRETSIRRIEWSDCKMLHRPKLDHPLEGTKHQGIVGRSAILAKIFNVINWLKTDTCKTDLARFVYVEGEAGIGKTFVLSYVVSIAEREALKVLTGSTYSIELATPYFAWREIVASVINHLMTTIPHSPRESCPDALPMEPPLSIMHSSSRTNIYHHLFRQFQKCAPELVEYLPLLSIVMPFHIPETQSSETLAGQLRAEKLEILLVKLLQFSQVSLVIIDNAQWLDSASWQLVYAVVQSLKGIAVILSGRPMVEHYSPSELQKLCSTPYHLHLKLDPLSLNEVIQLVQQKLDVTEVSPILTDFVVTKGGGNPLLAIELTDALIASGQIQMATITNSPKKMPELTRRLSIVGIPQTLRGLILGKVDRLLSSLQLILKIASVMGRIFEIDLLQDILRTIFKIPSNHNELFKALIDLENLNFIFFKSEEPLTYAFRQIITQEVIYDLMLFSQRRQLHAHIADWYELNQSGEQETYALIAHHYRKAEMPDRAMLYYSKAGEHAISNYANREAVMFFLEALELHKLNSANSVSSGSASYNDWYVLSWKRQLAQAFCNLGLLGRAGEILEEALLQMNEPIRLKVVTPLLVKVKAFCPKVDDDRAWDRLLNGASSAHRVQTNISGSSYIPASSNSNQVQFNAPATPSSLINLIDGRKAIQKRLVVNSNEVEPCIPTTVIPKYSLSSFAISSSSAAVYSVEYIRILLTLSKVYFYGCNCKAMTYCNLMAFKRAIQQGIAEELCEAVGNSILTLAIHKMHDVVQSYIKLGDKLVHDMSNISCDPQMNLLINAGTYYTGIQQWNRADDSFSKVIEMAKRVGNARRLEESSIFLSIVYFLQGRILDSQQLTGQVVASAKRRGDPQSQVMAYISQARNFLSLGQPDKASLALDEIRTITDQIDGYKLEVSNEINFHSLVALTHLVKEEFSLAYQSIENASKLIESTEPTAFFTFLGYTTIPQVLSMILQEHYKIGSTYKICGTLNPAFFLTKLQKSLKDLASFSKIFTFSEPSLLLWQGVAASLLDNSDGAIEKWRRSLALAESYGMVYDQGVALFKIGKCTNVRDSLEVVEEKIAAYDKAIDIFTEIGAVYTEIFLE